MSEENLILIVDDSDEDAVLLTLMFKRAGIVNPVTILSNGQQAISYLKGDGVYADRKGHPLPSVMFLDLKMPRVDGYKVLEWIARQPGLRSILVVVLSGITEPSDANRIHQLGARSFLVKPCTLEDLVNLRKVFPDYWTIARPPDPTQMRF
jgi:CheY-like chemotaxis protein